MPYTVRMFTVIETPTFVRLASNCWNDEDRTNFITFIAEIQMPVMLYPGQEACEKFVGGLLAVASVVGCA